MLKIKKPYKSRDYDGDMVSIKGIYSQEANEELDRLIKTPITLLDGSGSAVRSASKEAVLTLYSISM